MELTDITPEPAPAAAPVTPEKTGPSLGKGCLILFAAIVGIGMLIELFTPDTVSQQTTFAEAPDKQDWLRDHQEQTSGVELSLQLGDAIKAQFKFPDEVEFPYGESQIVKAASLLNVNLGHWQSIGPVKAKNAFGVLQPYQYNAKFIRTDVTEKVLSVEVREDF